MPELPEVETIRRKLEPHVIGRTFTEATADASPKFKVAEAVLGAQVEQLTRLGKYMIFQLDDGQELVAHLGHDRGVFDGARRPAARRHPRQGALDTRQLHPAGIQRYPPVRPAAGGAGRLL